MKIIFHRTNFFPLILFQKVYPWHPLIWSSMVSCYGKRKFSELKLAIVLELIWGCEFCPLGIIFLYFVVLWCDIVLKFGITPRKYKDWQKVWNFCFFDIFWVCVFKIDDIYMECFLYWDFYFVNYFRILLNS